VKVEPGVGGETRIYARNSHSKRKSIDDQIAEGIEDCANQGGEWANPVLTQDGGSASRYGRNIRINWRRNLADVRSGQVRRLWLWVSSRGDRQASQWLAFLELCEQMGVLIRVGRHDRTYNLSNSRDWKALAVDGIENDAEAREISAGVMRGLKHSAIQGKPHASTTFGYRRIYDPRSRDYLRQELDDEPRRSPTGWMWSPAGLVKEAKDRFLNDHEALTAIAESWNDRGIPAPRLFASMERSTPKGPEHWAHVRWTKQTVRRILLNPAYLGSRIHNGDEAKTDAWPALFTTQEYDEMDRRLYDPDRKTLPESARGREPRYLLSYVAECFECGAWLTRSKPRYEGLPEGYRCSSPKSCAAISLPGLDQYVGVTFVEWLITPGRLESLDDHDDAEPAAVTGARARARALEQELAELRQVTEDPNTKMTAEALRTYANREANLTTAIAECRAEFGSAGRASALRRFAGLTPEAAETLWNEGLDIETQRDMLREVMRIRVRPVGRGRRNVPVDDKRVVITWLR
jgi:site-specific DNA recombinase